MKRLFVVMALAACVTAPAPAPASGESQQTLTTPCVNPSDADKASCPACTTDADCGIVTNLCHPTGLCVPTAGKWLVTLEHCSVQHAPAPASACGCHDGVCR
jgi:hypothetical protein